MIELARLRPPALAALLAAHATACTVGPDFTPPKAPSTARYTSPHEAPAQATTLGAKMTAEWWTLFRSPAIDALVKDAIAGSPTLESASARLAEARETVAAASGARYPQVDFGASATRGEIDAASFGLHPDRTPLPANYNAFQLGPTVSYALDIFGGTHRQIEQTEALADVRRYQLDAAYQTLTGNAVTQAVQVAAARAQLQAMHDILELDQQNLQLVRTERQAGAVPDTDVVSAETQLAADETLLPAPEQQLDVARHALAVLLGRPPGEWSAPEFDLAGLALPQQLPISLPSQLVHQRPDILAAEAELHATSAQIGVATAQLYPSITLSGSVGAAALDPGHLFTPAGLFWSIAAGLTQPVFDGGMREAARRGALAAFKASAADYRQTVLQALGQVADVLQALSHDGQLLAAQQHALDEASESSRLQRISYSGGASGILQLLDAQRQYQQARLGYVRAEALRYQDTIQLLVAMGGGWWGTTPGAGNDGVTAGKQPA
jgi:NodT family efflux transporter outer membrane factor (OMF) lipoprotein